MYMQCTVISYCLTAYTIFFNVSAFTLHASHAAYNIHNFYTLSSNLILYYYMPVVNDSHSNSLQIETFINH
jgi:hypothetical protein